MRKEINKAPAGMNQQNNQTPRDVGLVEIEQTTTVDKQKNNRKKKKKKKKKTLWINVIIHANQRNRQW